MALKGRSLQDGATRGHIGVNLALTWPMSAHLGAMLRHFEAILAHLATILSHVGIMLRPESGIESLIPESK
eukprot:9434161-Karenia_brevis.AAC.1